MTRVVTLLFSDKKSEEEKGAVEWILLHAKKLKALLQNAKKSHPLTEVFGDVSEPLFSAPDADKNVFCVRILIIHFTRRRG